MAREAATTSCTNGSPRASERPRDAEPVIAAETAMPGYLRASWSSMVESVCRTAAPWRRYCASSSLPSAATSASLAVVEPMSSPRNTLLSIMDLLTLLESPPLTAETSISDCIASLLPSENGSEKGTAPLSLHITWCLFLTRYPMILKKYRVSMYCIPMSTICGKCALFRYLMPPFHMVLVPMASGKRLNRRLQEHRRSAVQRADA